MEIPLSERNNNQEDITNTLWRLQEQRLCISTKMKLKKEQQKMYDYIKKLKLNRKLECSKKALNIIQNGTLNDKKIELESHRFKIINSFKVLQTDNKEKYSKKL